MSLRWVGRWERYWWRFSAWIDRATSKKKKIKTKIFNLYTAQPAAKQTQSSASLISALQTTTLGRLKLYGILSKLGDRLLYANTDDVNKYVPEQGFCVGNLTDELASFKENVTDEPYISKFVCIGPKAYGYIVSKNVNDVSGQHVIKQKRISALTSNEQVNFYWDLRWYSFRQHWSRAHVRRYHSVETQI